MRHTDPLSDDARVGAAGLWLVGASFATVTGLVIALSLTGDVPDASVAGPSEKVEQSQPAQTDPNDPNATSTATPDAGADTEATPGTDANNGTSSDDATPGGNTTPTEAPTTQVPNATTPAPTTTQPALEKPNPQPMPVTPTPTPDRPHAATPTPKPTKPAPVTTMKPTKPVKPKPTKKTYSLQATSGELLLEKQAMTWLNEYRLANRLPVIAVNRCAVNEASAWSHQMRKENKIYHNPKPSCGTRRGENVAGGSFGSVAELMTAWKKSPGHNANMLSKNFTGAYVGIRIGETPDGKRRWYATTTFVG